MTEETRAIEPIAIMDALVTNVEAVEDLGNGLRRVIFAAPEGGEMHVTAKLLVTEADLLAILRKLSVYAARAIPGDAGPILLIHPPIS